MRLYDKLMAAPGSIIDQGYCGAFTSLARELRQAQCFVLAPDLAEACEDVCRSRPSSILSAQHTLRTPYKKMWFEWISADRDKTARPNDKPKPKLMGCLLLSNDRGDKGTAIYAWEHKLNEEFIRTYNCPEVTLNPFGIIFDWSGTATEEPVMSQYAKTIGLEISKEAIRRKYIDQREGFRKSLKESEKWRNLSRDDRELEAYMELEKSSGIIPLEMCKGLLTSSLGKDLRVGEPMFNSFMEDLAGEFSYTQAFLMMLNSRNQVVSQTKEDLSRLNKARAKNRKTPLKEFIITDLRLNKSHETRAGVLGIDRAAARRHMVRGHFKVRATGVYWFSAHLRGSGENSPVARRQYNVKL
jgi:hypothetical protein